MKKTIFTSFISTTTFGSWNVNLLLLGIMFPFAFSCNDDNLSRSEAEKLIRSTFPRTEVKEFTIYRRGYSYSSMQKGENELIERLENLGLVKCTMNALGLGATMELTEKGKQYIVSGNTDKWSHYIVKCEVSEDEFGGITGISQQKGSNAALVKYTQVRKKVTPFGKALNMNDGPFEVSLTLTKYDDGWRVGQ